MQDQLYRYNDQTGPPSPPNILFDGTRLGLEATLISALCFTVPAGLQCGLSITLGYFVRLSDGLPVNAAPFALGQFLGMSLFSMFILTMILFFSTSISTMLYTMLLVRFSLFWLGTRKKRDKLANAIAGGVLALVFSLPCSAFGLLVFNIPFALTHYAEVWRWPQLLSIDGMALLWMTALPFVAIIGGVRSGIKLGELAERMQMYWFF